MTHLCDTELVAESRSLLGTTVFYYRWYLSALKRARWRAAIAASLCKLKNQYLLPWRCTGPFELG
jgi:hypothetical protein